MGIGISAVPLFNLLHIILYTVFFYIVNIITNFIVN